MQQTSVVEHIEGREDTLRATIQTVVRCGRTAVVPGVSKAGRKFTRHVECGVAAQPGVVRRQWCLEVTDREVSLGERFTHEIEHWAEVVVDLDRSSIGGALANDPAMRQGVAGEHQLRCPQWRRWRRGRSRRRWRSGRSRRSRRRWRSGRGRWCLTRGSQAGGIDVLSTFDTVSELHGKACSHEQYREQAKCFERSPQSDTTRRLVVFRVGHQPIR